MKETKLNMEKQQDDRPEIPQNQSQSGQLAKSISDPTGTTGIPSSSSPSASSATEIATVKTPGSSRDSSPSTVLGTVDILLSRHNAILEEQRRQVASYGGHEGFLRQRARALLPLLPQGVSREIFESDTPAFWEDAGKRIEECARCPSYGGACAEGYLAWPDGEVIVPDEKKGIRGESCKKWGIYRVRERLMAGNVPAHLTIPDATLIPEHARQAMDETRRTGEAKWYFVTGGDPRRHEALVVALLDELVQITKRTFWYEVSASVFAKAIKHQRDPDLPDPTDRFRSVNALAFLIVTPERWKEWFVETVDEVLASRGDKTTIIAYAKSADALGELMPLTHPLFASAVQVELR